MPSIYNEYPCPGGGIFCTLGFMDPHVSHHQVRGLLIVFIELGLNKVFEAEQLNYLE